MDFLQGFGNGCIMPAGPLRENLAEGLKRSDALIGVGEGDLKTSKPFFKAQVVPQPLVSSLNRVIAFCGLGFPQKFYESLKAMGVDLVATQSFPDHYAYKEEDLVRLYKLSKTHRAVLVTTRKDQLKIPPSWQSRLHVLDINIQFEDSEGIYRFILEKIPSLKEDA